MTNTALILIDIQNDYFAGGRMPLENIESAATNAAALLNDAHTRDIPIFHIRHIAKSDSAPFFRPGTEGSEIHPRVCPAPKEAVIQKDRPNAFVGTTLEADLRTAGITHVTLCGAMSQMCVDATARAAVDLGFQVAVIEDACAAAQVSFHGVTVPAPQVHAAIMAPLAASYADVLTTAEALSAQGAA